MATGGLKPIRRVVTGNDERGKSKVVWDGPAPNAHEASMGSGRGHIDFWVWNDKSRAALRHERRRQPARTISPARRTAATCASCRASAAADYDPRRTRRSCRRTRRKRDELRPALGPRRHQRATRAACTRPRRSTTGSCSTASARSCSTTARSRWKPGDIVIDVGAWHQWQPQPRRRPHGVRHVRRALRRRARRARAGQRQA